MRGLTRFLILFMALRVLQPPGVCVCELTEPVERFLAEIFHGPRPQEHGDENNPHHACVLCQLPFAVQVKHVPAPPRPAPSADTPSFSAAVLVAAPDSYRHAALKIVPPPPDRPLYLRLRAFLI